MRGRRTTPPPGAGSWASPAPWRRSGGVQGEHERRRLRVDHDAADGDAADAGGTIDVAGRAIKVGVRARYGNWVHASKTEVLDARPKGLLNDKRAELGFLPVSWTTAGNTRPVF